MTTAAAIAACIIETNSMQGMHLSLLWMHTQNTTTTSTRTAASPLQLIIYHHLVLHQKKSYKWFKQPSWWPVWVTAMNWDKKRDKFHQALFWDHRGGLMQTETCSNESRPWGWWYFKDRGQWKQSWTNQIHNTTPSILCQNRQRFVFIPGYCQINVLSTSFYTSLMI